MLSAGAMKRLPFRLRWRPDFWRGVRVTAVTSAFVCALVAAAGYFDSDPYHLYPGKPPVRDVAVVNVSGDMGLRFGPNPTTTHTLAANGVTVVALKSPTLFRFHRTRGEVDRIVADADAGAALPAHAIRKALRQALPYSSSLIPVSRTSFFQMSNCGAM